jgi:hypothetical protein
MRRHAKSPSSHSLTGPGGLGGAIIIKSSLQCRATMNIRNRVEAQRSGQLARSTSFQHREKAATDLHAPSACPSLGMSTRL